MSESARILAFGAHPDDIEVRCSGTLALLRRAGWEVGIATVTGGEGGSREHGPEEIRKIRLDEAAEAAAVLDAPYYWAGGMDMDVDFRRGLRIEVVRVMRQFRPDVVVTVPPEDYHTDHEETSRLVRAACFFAPIPNYPGQELPPIQQVPVLYYTWAGRDILGRAAPVRFAVDITEADEIKDRMIACHRSQVDWIRAHHHTDDWAASIRRRDAELGARVGVPAAEGFLQHLGAGYPHEDPIADALGERVHALES